MIQTGNELNEIAKNNPTPISGYIGLVGLSMVAVGSTIAAFKKSIENIQQKHAIQEINEYPNTPPAVNQTFSSISKKTVEKALK